jgi:hypothetical protein
MAQDPSPRRFAIWAAFLVLPLVLAAVALPMIRRHLAAPGQPLAQAGAAARALEGSSAARAAQADAALEGGGSARTSPPPPQRRDGPTTAEIEAARAAQDELARAQRGWQRAEVLAPRQASRAADGELVAPFQGFGLSVESSPAGATVRVDGRELGQTPLVASIDCAPGAALKVRVERRSLRPVERTVRCRADALVTLQLALSR